ncbi:MAG: glycosyltransferase [Acidobacteria bacterium]|nr:glycosyltransferase [Acidobacteriota bacterium]
MTVLYFADTRFPIERANGAQTMATCRALAARGHETTLVVRPDSAVPPRDPFAFYGLAPVTGLAVQRVPASGPGWYRRLTFLLAARRRVRAAPDATIYTRDLGVASFLLGDRRFDARRLVYESHGIAPVVSREMPALLGRPDLAPSPAKLDRLDRREQLVWRRAGAYVTITRCLADDLAARYGPRDHVVVAPDGADDPGVGGADRAPDGAAVAAYAGHLYPWKGVDVFVRALAAAPHVRGLIVGGHRQEADLSRVEALARECRVRDRLEMTGPLPPAGVARALVRASILVLPNTASAISERYTSPLKLFEYLWLARPIVASDLPSLREVLTPEAAIFVPPGDAAALGAALERLAADPALAASLGRRARQLAPAFTWARRAERLEQALLAAGGTA